MTFTPAPSGGEESPTKLDRALEAARRGLRVFPVSANAKSPPLVKDYPAVATNDEAQICSWWGRWPDANIGVSTDGLLVLDVDTKGGKTGPASLWRLSEELDEALDLSTLTTRTPHGWHYYFSVSESVSGLAGWLPGIDLRSRHNYVLGPGSVVADRAYTVEIDAPIMSAPAPLVAKLHRPRKGQKSRDPVSRLDTPAAVASVIHYLTRQAPIAIEGAGGDATTFKVACHVRDLGVSQMMAWELMAEHWLPRCQHSWSEGEALEWLETKVRNAYAYGENRPGAKSVENDYRGMEPIEPPRGEARSDLRLRFPGDEGPTCGPDWLIKKLLPRIGVALLAGQSRVGKTLLAVDLAGAVATGGTFFQRQVRRRAGVLIIAGEGFATMESRIEALRRHFLNGVDPSELPIAWCEARTATEAQAWIPIARQELQALFGVQLGLIIVDTMAAVFNVEDENDAHKATTAMKALQEFSTIGDCLALGVTHFGKNAEAGVRGSSAWTASADVVLAATARISETSGAVSDRCLALIKSRYADTGPISGFQLLPVFLSFDEDGDEIGAPVIRMCAARKLRKPSRHVELIRQCFDEAREEIITESGARSMALRQRVRALFAARKEGSKNSGNISREFRAATTDVGLVVVTVAGQEYLAFSATGSVFPL